MRTPGSKNCILYSWLLYGWKVLFIDIAIPVANPSCSKEKLEPVGKVTSFDVIKHPGLPFNLLVNV